MVRVVQCSRTMHNTSRPPFDVDQYARETASLTVRPPPAPSLPSDLGDLDAPWAGAPVVEARPIPVLGEPATTSDATLTEAFLLLHVDGVSSLEAIARISGVPDAEAILHDLVARGMIRLGPPGSSAAPRRSTIRPTAGEADPALRSAAAVP